MFYGLITLCGGLYHASVKFDDKGKVIDDPATGKPMVGNAAAAHTYIAMVFLYNFWYAIAYTPLLVSYTVEVFDPSSPFHVREC